MPSELTAVFFPFTFLPPPAAAWRRLFPSLAVYQPSDGDPPEEMAALVRDGFLQVIGPGRSDRTEFSRLLRELEDWGREHRGGAGLAALQHAKRGDGIAGADEDPFDLAAQVRRRLSPEPAPTAPEPDLAARVFLHLAQEADRLRWQTDEALARCDETAARLVGALRGEPRPGRAAVAAPRPAPEDEDRLALRLAAWSRLYLRRPFPSSVFVTPDPAVLRLLIERIPGSRRLPSLEPPADARGLLAALAETAAGGRPLPKGELGAEAASAAAGGEGGASVWVWSEIPPIRFFSLLTAPARAAASPDAVRGHTVVVLTAPPQFSSTY